MPHVKNLRFKFKSDFTKKTKIFFSKSETFKTVLISKICYLIRIMERLS